MPDNKYTKIYNSLEEYRDDNAGAAGDVSHKILNFDCERYLNDGAIGQPFDLIVTSPPYNIGKSYESNKPFREYIDWQTSIIELLVPRLSENGSLCWQVGNYVNDNEIFPLDIEFVPIFRKLGLKLRNRIVWHFGHGLHSQRRFSGRYETVLWFTKSDSYTFNLDDVRIPSKYPGKRHFKGPNKGEISGNPLGKNPEDVWAIPNVKGNHVEKTEHPCQFPIGLIERLILGLTHQGHVVYDPFAGVGSAAAAAALHGRRSISNEIDATYCEIAHGRIQAAAEGLLRYRPHDKPLYDHTQSPLSHPVKT